jgi:LPS O-antigen subunit length determinant protein (WzzB/FepE family)
MSVNDKAYDDEIDLLEWFQTIWEGKWKIASIMAVSLLSVFGFNTVLPNTTFIAQTEIKPITSFELDKYRLFNASLKRFDTNNVEIKIFNISKENLLALYIEQIEEGSLLETGIDKFQLINKDNFENDNDYKEAIQKFASDIEILRPINVDGQEKGEIRLHHVLNAEYNDEDKWKELLSFVNNEANKEIKNILTSRFKNIVSVENQKNNFAIRDIEIQIDNAEKDFDKKMEQFELEQQFKFEDVNTEIENAKKDFDKKMEQFELEQQFKLEDVTTQIDNATKDYDRITKDRLAFLSEQAAIARKLGVKKNTIESQMFDTQNTVVTNVKTDTPFYLRGYEAIEEEINLIKGRKDKISFVKDLFKLEQEKRKLEQDRTLQRAEKNKVFLESLIALEVKKRAIEQDETLDRAKDLFNKTPLSENVFKSTMVKVAATDFESNNKRNLYYALALVLGGMIGVVFVLISKALINRKAITAQS